MFAAQNQEPSILDALGSNVTDWYNTIDEGLRKSDIVPGTYEYTNHVSYGNVGAIPEGESTMLDIQLNRFCVASLDNSYVTVQQTLPITPKSTTALKDAKVVGDGVYYAGYEYSAEVFDNYDIQSNADRIQSVPHANYEWFLLRNSVQPEAKEESEHYATLAKIRRRDPRVPGVYVDLSKLDKNTEFKAKLDLKVPLNSFLLFRQLRYLLSSFGTLTLTVTPSYKNLVIAPAFDPSSVDSIINMGKQTPLAAKAIVNYYKEHSRELDFGFHNLNQPFNQLLNTHVAAKLNSNKDAIEPENNTVSHEAITFACSTQVSDKIELHTAYYMLQMDVFNSISARYQQIPLIFPIQKIESKEFATPLDSEEHIDTGLTVQLRHADGMAVVFKKDLNSHSCFENPQIKYQFNIDGKTFPRQEYATVDDLRTINQTLDYLNFNNLATTSIDKDLSNSLQPYTKILPFAAGGGNHEKPTAMYTSGDRSNFMIGIPFADGCDFQGGISTNGTIQIQLKGTRLDYGGNESVKYLRPEAIFTEDAILKIRTVKPPGSPQISITNASIEQVIAAAGAV